MNRYPHQRLHQGGRHLNATWIEALIWDHCRAFIRNPEETLTEARQQLQERLGAVAHFEQEQGMLQHTLGQKAIERDRVLTLFRRGRVSLPEIEGQLEAITREEADIRQQLALLEVQRQTTTVFEGQYLEAYSLLTRLQERVDEIEQTNAYEIKRQVIELLVSDVIVESDPTTRQGTVNITYHFSPRGTQISLPV